MQALDKPMEPQDLAKAGTVQSPEATVGRLHTKAEKCRGKLLSDESATLEIESKSSQCLCRMKTRRQNQKKYASTIFVLATGFKEYGAPTPTKRRNKTVSN